MTPELAILIVLAAPALGILAWLLIGAAFGLRERDLVPSVDVAHPIWMDRKGGFWTAVRGGKRVLAEDPFWTKVVPIEGLAGVSVRICGPGFNHNWGVALPPHLAPVVLVTLDEWRRIEGDIPPGFGCGTDLIVRTEDPRASVCSMWDPHARRWVILSEEDARRPTA